MLEKNDSRQQMMSAAFEEVLEERSSEPSGCEVLREIDRGGTAVVYLARQWEPRREVALKVVQPRFMDEEEVSHRFKREGWAMAALEHPGILPIYQVGEWDGLAYIMMKFARGGSLQDVLQKERPKIAQAVSWVIAGGKAVQFAHENGVLHRDLKPGNFLFDEDGSIYVADFGAAAMDFAPDGGLTQSNIILGTPHYLAPEIASGRMSSGTEATDVYGMGMVLYECLTGQRPYQLHSNVVAQLRVIIEEAIEPVRQVCPEVPSALAAICEKALAKNPGDRYPKMADFVEDLRRFQEGQKVRAVRRNPLLMSVIISAALLIVSAGLLAVGKLKAGASESAEAKSRPVIATVEGGQSWLNSYVWSDGLPPSSKKDYLLTPQGKHRLLRSSPENELFGGTADFRGHSLTVDQGTTLLVKQEDSEVASIRSGAGDLILNGGRVLFGPGGGRLYLGWIREKTVPVFQVNRLQVQGLEKSLLQVNHRVSRVLVDGVLSGSGDLAIGPYQEKTEAGAAVAFSQVDRAFTGTITVNGKLILDFNSEVYFEGGVTILEGARLNVDQELSFPKGRLRDAVNGVISPGKYEGEKLKALGACYQDANGLVIVRP